MLVFPAFLRSFQNFVTMFLSLYLCIVLYPTAMFETVSLQKSFFFYTYSGLPVHTL